MCAGGMRARARTENELPTYDEAVEHENESIMTLNQLPPTVTSIRIVCSCQDSKIDVFLLSTKFQVATMLLLIVLAFIYLSLFYPCCKVK